jgi:P pilus assembly chaperone PapD
VKRDPWLMLCPAIVSLLLSLDSSAAISLGATRLVFDGRLPEASLSLLNRGSQEVLIQAWLSKPDNVSGDPDAVSTDLPFALTPPLAKLDAGSAQTLRLLYQGAGMAPDVETLLHLYVLEVPKRAALSNPLSIAIRQRVNVFYRPAGLKGDPVQTASSLIWTLIEAESGEVVLRVSNPTAFYAALKEVRFGASLLRDYMLLPPGADHQIPVPYPAIAAALTFKALNDYGGLRAYCGSPSKDAPHHAEYRSKEC